MRKEIEALEYHADFAPDRFHFLLVVGQFEPIHRDAAAVVLLQPVDAADHGRFARAGRPADHHLLTLRDREVNVSQRLVGAVILVHIFQNDDVGHGPSLS
jgi:hypothetical protein